MPFTRAATWARLTGGPLGRRVVPLTIGSTLRDARRRAEHDLAECEAATKIRAKYLMALEEERFEVLPEPAYVRGMLRAYADHLGLRPGPLLEEYDHLLGREEAARGAVPAPTGVGRPLPGVRPRRGRRSVPRLGWLLAGAVAGAAALVWAGASREPERVQPLAPLPERTTASAPTVVTTPPTPTVRSTPPAPARPAAAALTIRGRTGGSWLQVRRQGPEGEVLFEGTIASGVARRFPIGARLWVRVGWGAGLAATVGGRRASLPDGTGDVVVTREGIRPAPA